MSSSRDGKCIVFSLKNPAGLRVEHQNDSSICSSEGDFLKRFPHRGRFFGPYMAEISTGFIYRIIVLVWCTLKIFSETCE